MYNLSDGFRLKYPILPGSEEYLKVQGILHELSNFELSANGSSLEMQFRTWFKSVEELKNQLDFACETISGDPENWVYGCSFFIYSGDDKSPLFGEAGYVNIEYGAVKVVNQGTLISILQRVRNKETYGI